LLSETCWAAVVFSFCSRPWDSLFAFRRLPQD